MNERTDDPNRGRLRLSFIIMHEILNAAQQTNPVNENSWTSLIAEKNDFFAKLWDNEIEYQLHNAGITC